MKRPFLFWGGVSWIVFLICLFFIKITIDSGINYIERTSLLGLIVFYNPVVLFFYVLIGIAAVLFGIWNFKIK